jgi:hypothetical protein
MRRVVPAAILGAIATGAIATGAIATGAIAKGTPAPAPLTAAQIVAKNEGARGGVEAWRKIQTMVWSGRMESAHTPERVMAFVLDQARPNKTRFDLTAMSQHSERVFDGENGWRSRPQAGGRLDVQPFTLQELKFAREAQTIDGPLIDYRAKGNEVALLGDDLVEGRKAYRLNVRLASGEHEVVWIDAQTFLDVRLDRISFSSAGMPGMVSIVYRDFQIFDGVKIPMVMEMGAGSGKIPDKMIIEKVLLNPVLDARTFKKPANVRLISQSGTAQQATTAQRATTAPLATPPDATPSPPVSPRPELESERR